MSIVVTGPLTAVCTTQEAYEQVLAAWQEYLSFTNVVGDEETKTVTANYIWNS